MKWLVTALVAAALAFGDDSKKDCVEFTEEIPKFSEKELVIVDRYLAQIIETRPRAFAEVYLSKIEKIETGYEFVFNSMIHLRAHKCPDFITLISDGQFSVSIDLKAERIVLNSMVKERNGNSWKLKK